MSDIQAAEPQAPVLRTVQQFCGENLAFTEGGIRWQIFNEDTNGLRESGAIVRVGRRVYINVPLYFSWITSQQNHLTRDASDSCTR